MTIKCYVESGGGACQYGGEMYYFDAGLIEAKPWGMLGSEPDYFERSRDLAIHACGKIGGQYVEKQDKQPIQSVTVGGGYVIQEVPVTTTMGEDVGSLIRSARAKPKK